MCRNDFLSTFGSLDMTIRPSNSAFKSLVKLGSTYELPQGCKRRNTKKALNYLAGSPRFTIKEIEVFLIKFKR